MRPALTKVVAASLAALLAGATATTSEAAHWHGGGWHGGGRGWHGGGGGWHGGGWHHGWGGWGPGVVGGLAAGAIIGGALAAPYAYGYGGYYQDQPIYSPNGVYLGSQLVNIC